MGLEAFTKPIWTAIREFVSGESDEKKFANMIVGTFMRRGILLELIDMRALVIDIRKDIQTLKDQGNSYNQLSIEEKTLPVKEIVCSHLGRLLGSRIAPTINLKKGEPNVVLFIGCAEKSPDHVPRKCGKVTAIARYARHHKKNGCRTYVVCADPMRSDAYDRLKPLLEGMEGIRCHNCQQRPERSPVVIAREGLDAMKREDALATATDSHSEKPTSIFIMDVNTRDLLEIAKEIGCSCNVILVVDSKDKTDTEDELLRIRFASTGRFKWFDGDLIITKADGSFCALHIAATKACTIAMIGMGTEIDDYELTVGSFIRKLLEPLDDQSGTSAQNPPLPPLDPVEPNDQQTSSCPRCVESKERENNEDEDQTYNFCLIFIVASMPNSIVDSQ